MQPGIAKPLQLVQREQTANKSRKILHTSYPFQIKFLPIDLNVYYIDSLVSRQEICKYLGVHLDFKLNFLDHIRLVESKVAKAVGILSKLRSQLPKFTLLLLYHALIHPHLIYALPLWGCTFSSYLQKLQLLQNKAIRIICNTSRYSSANILFHKLGILKIGDLYQYETGKLMYQYSKNNLPTGLSALFVNLSAIHNRQTRSQSLKSLYLPKFSPSRCQRSVKFQGTKIWNFISPELKTYSYNKFKTEFKNQLIATYNSESD